MHKKQKTHLLASEKLVGKVKDIRTGKYVKVMLRVTKDMVVDGHGLIHGGFTFGLADYAAMVVINHPFVVLASSNVKFLKPVSLNDVLIAEARVVKEDGRKKTVFCDVFNQKNEKVFEGEFVCLILDRHVLEK